MEIRVTSLNTFESCPRRWFAENVLGLKLPNAAADEGTATHAVAERWLKQGKGFPGFEQAAREEVAKHPTLTEANITDVVRMAKRCVKNYERPLDMELHAEVRMTMFVGNHRLSGTADVLMVPIFPGEPLRIIDFKTGRNRKPTRQLAVYAYMALNTVATQAAREALVRYDWVRLGEVDEFQYGPDELAETADWVKAQVSAIDAALRGGEEAFACNPSGLCAYCGHAQQCPATRGEYQPLQVAPAEDLPEIPQNPELLTREMAEKYGLQLLAWEAKVKQVEDVLKAWTEKHGAIRAGGKIMGKMETEPSRKYNLKKVFQRITDKGLDPFKYISLTSTEAKKLEKEGVDLDGTFTLGKAQCRWTVKKDDAAAATAAEAASAAPATVGTSGERVDATLPALAASAQQESGKGNNQTASSVVQVVAAFGQTLKQAGAPEGSLTMARQAYRLAEAGKLEETFWDLLNNSVPDGLTPEVRAELVAQLETIERLAVPAEMARAS
ncbi:DUF2800 domain-containing protein [Heliobacterium undosum]|uniref:DUF2800 domain-containing protein n=1 Tax=Heliomicrobium undosum TaxID=121734 RepID=A0A845LEQ7_9FIRM|nr:PD-(D/E)XK nuclease family protein [Heliomicrobium undosum]MZP31411.1 DUF2800 domain-containing protein [Heliomicrobium undosum]